MICQKTVGNALVMMAIGNVEQQEIVLKYKMKSIIEDQIGVH